MRRPITLLALGLAVLAVAGCDPDEQGRPLYFTGSYNGPQKPGLSPQTLDALAARAERQRGPVSQPQARSPRASGGGSPWGAGASVRVGNGT